MAKTKLSVKEMCARMGMSFKTYRKEIDKGLLAEPVRRDGAHPYHTEGQFYAWQRAVEQSADEAGQQSEVRYSSSGRRLMTMREKLERQSRKSAAAAAATTQT